MIDQVKCEQIVIQSVGQISNRPVQISSSYRLIDYGIDLPVIDDLIDQIVIIVQNLGYNIDVPLLKGSVHPNQPTSNLAQTLQYCSYNYYSSPPGGIGSIKAEIYECPSGDYTYAKPSSGATVPKCPTHGVDLRKKP